jgi:hypothetical protein
MRGKADDDDFTPKQIALELKEIAELLRKGPLPPAELAQVTARVEILARAVLQWPDTDPDVGLRLRELAAELRNSPVKRKNGAAS